MNAIRLCCTAEASALSASKPDIESNTAHVPFRHGWWPGLQPRGVHDPGRRSEENAPGLMAHCLGNCGTAARWHSAVPLFVAYGSTPVYYFYHRRVSQGEGNSSRYRAPLIQCGPWSSHPQHSGIPYSRHRSFLSMLLVNRG